MTRQGKKRRGRALLAAAVLLAALGGGLALRAVGGDAHPRPTPVQSAPRFDDQGADTPLELYSPVALLVECGGGQVLLSQRGEERIYPASLTKIMTVMLGMEALPDWNATVRLPSNFQSLYAANASMAGFLSGEEVRVADLFYGALLPSGADACLGIATAVSGSEPAFVERMNRRARELGMEGTHFVNADGLHHPDHYSTATDIALLLDSALQNPAFCRVFTAHSYTTTPSSAHPNGLFLTSTLFDVGIPAQLGDGAILGGKTGYTEEASLCLATLLQKGDKRYLLVTAGAPGSHQSAPYHVEDAFNICQNALPDD